MPYFLDFRVQKPKMRTVQPLIPADSGFPEADPPGSPLRLSTFRSALSSRSRRSPLISRAGIRSKTRRRFFALPHARRVLNALPGPALSSRPLPPEEPSPLTRRRSALRPTGGRRTRPSRPASALRPRRRRLSADLATNRFRDLPAQMGRSCRWRRVPQIQDNFCEGGLQPRLPPSSIAARPPAGQHQEESKWKSRSIRKR